MIATGARVRMRTAASKIYFLLLATTVCLIGSATAVLYLTQKLADARTERAEMIRKQIAIPVIEVEETAVSESEAQPIAKKPAQTKKNQNPLIILGAGSRNDPPGKSKLSSEAAIERVKSATCLLTIAAKNGLQRQGTAFVVQKSNERTILVTHSQLVVWDDDEIQQINCSFNTGVAGSTFRNAKICGEIEDSHFILLETDSVPGVDPIDPFESVDATVTLPILAFGFPFGKALATGNLVPNVSVTSGIVSSLRNDPLNREIFYQLDCRFHPGNAGGPVVTQDGKLVGVAFSKVQGEAFGFVEPIDKLKRALSGTLTSMRVQEMGSRHGNRILNVGFKQFDPNRNIAKFDVLTFRKSSLLHGEKVDGRWVEASEEWHAHPMFAENAVVTVDVRLPKAASNIFFQVRAEAKDGSFTYFEPQELAATADRGRDTPDRWQKITLPSNYSDVDVAAGGRYLVFHFAEQNKLAVLDTRTRSITKEIELHGNGLCAAGMDKIVFVRGSVILSWDLATFELGRTGTLAKPSSPTEIALGHSSHGPILIGSRQLNSVAVRFVDLESLEAIPMADEKTILLDGQSAFRASGDGTTFTRIHRFATVCSTLVLDSNPSVFQKAIHCQEFPTSQFSTRLKYLQPNEEGTRFYTNQGIFTQNWKPASQPSWTQESGLPLPAVQGSYFLTIGYHPSLRNPTIHVATVSIEHESVQERLLPRTELPGMGNLLDDSNDSLTLDQRIYFMPEDKLLVVAPKPNNEIFIRGFDIDAELLASRKQHLFVTSKAPVRASVGELFEYQLTFKSKRKIVAFRVNSGPEGIRISPEGKITWTPILDDVGDQFITVAIDDDWGKTILHSFGLKVEKATE